MITFRVQLSPRLSLRCKSVSKTGYVRGTNFRHAFYKTTLAAQGRALVQLRIKPI